MAAVLESTANQIILAALLDSGIIRPDQVPSSEDTAIALARLNSMTKRWQAQGHHLWAQTEGVVFLDENKQSYRLGPSGDEATTADDFVGTSTSTALVGDAVFIAVDSTAGMTGAAEIITIDPISTQFWTPTNADVTVEVDNLRVANNTTAAGFADFDLTCTVGQTYRVVSDFVVGTSNGIMSIRDPVADLQIETSGDLDEDTEVEFDFVATQEIMTFRLANVSVTNAQYSELSSLSQIDKSTGDFIGIKQTDGIRHWTKIVEIIDDTNLEINKGMLDLAPSGAKVFTFTDLMERPMRIYNERTQKVGSFVIVVTEADEAENVKEEIEVLAIGSELPVRKWTRRQYMRNTLKSTPGIVNKMYYNPLLVNGKLFVWPTSSDSNDLALFTFDRPLQVSGDQLDSPDFPSEWFDALKWNLAVQLLPAYRVPADTAQLVMANASSSLEEALAFDEETGSLLIQPTNSHR